MSRETERLESQIQQDRQEVKHTLDALQDKFSVDSIIQDLFGASNGGTKNTAEQIWSQLRNHPAPALMTVAGLIWLSASAAKSDGGHSWSDEDRTTLQRYNRLRALEGRFQRFDSETDEAFMNRQYSARASELGIENTQGERFEEFKKKVDEAAKKVNDSAHGLLSRIESAGSTMASGVSNAQEKAKRSVSSAAEGAKERLSEGASALKHQGDWVADRATALHNSNPLAIGAVAIAAGALLGGLIPNTRFENETMGRSADWAKSKASEAVGEAVDAAGAEAEKAGERMNKQT